MQDTYFISGNYSGEIMTLKKLQRNDDTYQCPNCGGPLEFSDGGFVAIVNGRLDMENYKPRYNCKKCGVFYREVMSTGYYDVFPMEAALQEQQEESGDTAGAEKTEPVAEENTLAAKSGPVALEKDADGKRHCPKCGREFRVVDGGAVRVVNGKVDMENTKPKYECDSCGVFYREVLTSGFYLPYPQEEEDKPKQSTKAEASGASPKKMVATGELSPMQLKRDENGQCKCPRCGEMMKYVEGGAVTLVDGKPNMDDVLDRFACDSCGSVYRRIVNTDYFQWFEK